MIRPVSALAAALLLALAAVQPAAAAPADSRTAASKDCVWNKVGAADRAGALDLYRRTGALLKDETYKGRIWDAAQACGAADAPSGLAAVLAFNGRIQAQAGAERLGEAGITASRLHEAWGALPAEDRDFAMALGASMSDGGRPSGAEMDRFDAVMNAYAKALGVAPQGPVSDQLVVFLSGHFMSGDPI